MKIAIKLAFTASLMIFILNLTALHGTTTGVAEGFVVDALSGQPIPNVKVTLVSAKSERIRFELFTNKKGYFYKSGLPLGAFKVIVEKEGYMPTSGSIRVSLARPAKVEIKLETFESKVPASTRLSNQGTKLLSEGRYEEAIELFTEAISEDPINPIYHYYLGSSFEKNGNLDKALEAYQKSIELKPDFILPVSSAARIYAKKQDYKKAVEFFKNAAELGDLDATTFYNYGVCLLNNGMNAEAKMVFERLLGLDEDYTDAYYHLGIICVGLGQTEEAKEYLQKFVDMDPENQNASIAREILKYLNIPLK